MQDFLTDRLLFSATHEEILRGDTSDFYFPRTMKVLEQVGKDNTLVIAEIFPCKDGVLCGVEEVLKLLSGRSLEIWGLKEGELFYKKEVVMRISGQYSAFGVYETAILGILASSSGWATAARESVLAAGGSPVVSFGARHVHPAVAPVLDRSAVLGGASGGSCVLGARIMGMEPRGTMPHAYILIMGDTLFAAQKYHEILPENAPRIVLVDTFKDEAEESLRVADALGTALLGVRLDTPGERGRVTPELVKEVRSRLDQAGHNHVKIFASGGLTPERISLLKEAGADSFGVGGYISGASPIDMTMDLKVVDGKPIAKRGRIPGITDNPRLIKLS